MAPLLLLLLLLGVRCWRCHASSQQWQIAAGIQIRLGAETHPTMLRANRALLGTQIGAIIAGQRIRGRGICGCALLRGDAAIQRAAVVLLQRTAELAASYR